MEDDLNESNEEFIWNIPKKEKIIKLQEKEVSICINLNPNFTECKISHQCTAYIQCLTPSRANFLSNYTLKSK